MTEWMMEHPYLTFFLAALLLSNVTIAIGRSRRSEGDE